MYNFNTGIKTCIHIFRYLKQNADSSCNNKNLIYVGRNEEWMEWTPLYNIISCIVV